MKKPGNSRVIFAVAAATLVAACGGGGGSSGDPLSAGLTVDYPLASAHAAYLASTESRTFSITGAAVTGGTAYPITGSGSFATGGLVAGTFEGVSALGKAMTVNGSFTLRGSSVALDGTETAYFDSNHRPLGGTGSEYWVVTSSTALPATARVLATGTMYTANRYSDSTKTTWRGTETLSYAIGPDTSSTALVTLTETERDTSGTTTATSTRVWRMNTTGVLTRLSETAVIHDTSPTVVTTLNLSY